MAVDELLLNLGFSPALKGFNYLSSLIALRLNDPDYKLTAAYYAVGRTFGVSWERVERCARTALNTAIDSAGLDRFYEIFGFWSPLSGRFTVGDFVALCAHHLTKHRRP